MSEERKNEVGRFALSGILATLIDYVLLNLGVVLLGLPTIAANTISATLSSVFSYNFNKEVVFHDRLHGRHKTLVLYVVILGFGILVIQNGILHLIEHNVAHSIAEMVHPGLRAIGLGAIGEPVLALNIAKLLASLVAAWCWNYFMLRRFVFVTKEEAKQND